MKRDPVMSYMARLLTLLMFLVLALWPAAIEVKGQQTGTAQGQATVATPQQTLQSVVAKQAALVTEFDVNGLKVIVKRREGSPTVAAGLFIRGGARNITAQNAGIEALMLAAATEASANFPRAKMRDELSRMGTLIGYGVNYDYSALTLGSTRPNFQRSWELFTDVALRPTFAKADVDLVQSRIVTSLRDDTVDPDSYLQRLQEGMAYAGHPYLNRPQGTSESVSRLTLEDLRRHHQQVMVTSKLLLVLVGDLDAAQLKTAIGGTFGKLPRGDYRSELAPQLSFDKPAVVVTERGLPTNYVQGVFTAPPLTSPDIYPMRVATSMLRDRVFEEVRVRRNLSYAPNAFLGSQGANLGGIYVTAVDANQAVRVMLAEITRLQREPLTPDDITAIIAQYLTSYYMGQETNAAQAGELAQHELIGGGWRSSVQVMERLNAVTPEDVQRVAQKYMRNIRFVVLGDPQSIDEKEFTGVSGEQPVVSSP